MDLKLHRRLLTAPQIDEALVERLSSLVSGSLTAAREEQRIVPAQDALDTPAAAAAVRATLRSSANVCLTVSLCARSSTSSMLS